LATKYILAILAVVFWLLVVGRIARDGGRVGPAARSWLIIAVVFSAVSAWLWFGVGRA